MKPVPNVYDWLLGRWIGREELGGAPGAPRAFPHRYQRTDYTCAPRSVQMVLEYYRRGMTFEAILRALGTDKDGTYMAPIARLLRTRGLAVGRYPRMQVRELERGLVRGIVLVQVDGDHLAVVHDIDEHHVYIADPSPSRCKTRRHTRARFRARWDNWGMVVTDPDNGRPTPPRAVPLEVPCPATGARIEVRSADGEYRCPDCGRNITVASLEAAHA